MRRRASRIRRSVAVLAVTLFVIACLAVYVQLSSGHDPALAAAAKRHDAATSTKDATPASASETAAGASSGAQESSGPSAVTTSQS
jgi:hypothetical protein